MTINTNLLQRILHSHGAPTQWQCELSAIRQFTLPHRKTYDKPSWNFDGEVRILAGNSYRKPWSFHRFQNPAGGLAHNARQGPYKYNAGAADMDDTILETKGLTKEFRGFVAVNGVDLRIKRGEIHALIGPNGAGKTTCFNLLTKFLAPTSGSIKFNGIDITGERPAQIARRGVIRSFQISAVFPHLTVLENVRIGLQRKTGLSFHFWQSTKRLAALDEPARALL